MTSTVSFLCACIAAAGLATGCGASTPATTEIAGATTGAGMDIQFSTTPPVSGDNVFEVAVRKDGAPVNDARVTVRFGMPAMPGMNMPDMHGETVLPAQGDGRYRGTARLAMGGTWNIRVTVSRSGAELGAKTLSLVAR